MMDDNIQHYRQPMVTAIGIILGFVLGFIGKWATEPVETTETSDYIICIGLFVCVVLLMIALYRILNNAYPTEKAAIYYKLTLKYFITGLTIAFLSVLIAVFQTIRNN